MKYGIQVLVLTAALSSMNAGAGVVKYEFSASSVPFGNAQLISLLGSDAKIVGSFKYDNSVPATGSTLTYGYGTALGYGLPYKSFFDIAASVGSFGYTDPVGNTIVGNDMSDYPGRPPGQDWLGLYVDPGIAANSTYMDDRPRNLVGFTIENYRLVNARMYWFTGINGLGDFLSSDSLPVALPTLQAQLALDFVLVSDPTHVLYSNTVFFNGLTVHAQAVPEPNTVALTLMGLLFLSGMLVRRLSE